MKYRASRKDDLEITPDTGTLAQSASGSVEVKGRQRIRRKMNLEEAPFIKKA